VHVEDKDGKMDRSEIEELVIDRVVDFWTVFLVRKAREIDDVPTERQCGRKTAIVSF
jgi:hypothetical protein